MVSAAHTVCILFLVYSITTFVTSTESKCVMHDVSVSHCFSSPKASAYFFLSFFFGLLPTTAHLPFAMALFTVGGGGGEEREKAKELNIKYCTSALKLY